MDDADDALFGIYSLALEFIAGQPGDATADLGLEEMARVALADAALGWGPIWRARHQYVTWEAAERGRGRPGANQASRESQPPGAVSDRRGVLERLAACRRDRKAALQVMRDALATIGAGECEDPRGLARAALRDADQRWNELARAAYRRALAAL